MCPHGALFNTESRCDFAVRVRSQNQFKHLVFACGELRSWATGAVEFGDLEQTVNEF